MFCSLSGTPGNHQIVPNQRFVPDAIVIPLQAPRMWRELFLSSAFYLRSFTLSRSEEYLQLSQWPVKHDPGNIRFKASTFSIETSLNSHPMHLSCSSSSLSARK